VTCLLMKVEDDVCLLMLQRSVLGEWNQIMIYCKECLAGGNVVGRDCREIFCCFRFSTMALDSWKI